MATSMQIELSPELQSLVQGVVESGVYGTPEEVIAAALQDWADALVNSPTAMERLCDEAIEDSRSGITSDELRQRMADYCRDLDRSQQVGDAA